MNAITDFDALASAVPVDRTAALVIAPGVHWDPKRPENWPAKSYDAPPRVSRWTQRTGDLTGTRYGRITVLGLLRAKKHWSLWLVRCDCGAYEDRTAGSIANHGGRTCWRCDRLWRMQEGRDLEVAAPRQKPKKLETAVEVVLAARSVRRASGMDPRTVMHAALAEALQRRVEAPQ